MALGSLPVLAGGFLAGSIALPALGQGVAHFPTDGVYGANLALACYEGLVAWDAYTTADRMNRVYGMPVKP